MIIKKVINLLRIPKDYKDRKNLKNKDFTIISSNYVGGIIYHNLGLKFLSPTINLFFQPGDFLKFCENIEYYVKVTPKDAKKGLAYPVMRLDDIYLYGLHYADFEQMKNKWNLRKKRINFDNIYIIFSERDNCTYNDLVRFDKLKYSKKIVFTHKKYENISSSYYIKNTDINDSESAINKIEPLSNYKSKLSPFKYIDNFDYVSWINERK